MTQSWTVMKCWDVLLMSENGYGKDPGHTWVIKVVLALECFRFLIWSQHFVEAVLAYNSHLPLTMVHLVLTQELHDLGANCWLCQKITSFTRLLFRSTLAVVIMLHYIRLRPNDSRGTERVVICDPLNVVVVSWLCLTLNTFDTFITVVTPWNPLALKSNI